jgi:Domain of unknown function (DUF5664)
MPFSDLCHGLVGNQTGAAIQWKRRSRGCGDPPATDGVPRMQAGEQAQPERSNEGGGGAVPWTYPCSIPSQGQGGVDGDSQAVGLESPVGAGLQRYESGAVRSHLPERYDLVPALGIRAVAQTMAEGAVKYGEQNWQKGMPIGDTLNHVLAHVYKYLSGDRTESHLSHAAAGLLMAIHLEESNGKDRG